VRTTTKDGQTKIEGFDFQPDRVVGLKDLEGNAQAAYDVAAPQGTFNFETDTEFLQALPLAKGYEAQIVFHHPGGGPPAPYVFKVTGSEVLTSSAGGKVDCWVMTTDYNHPEGQAVDLLAGQGQPGGGQGGVARAGRLDLGEDVAVVSL
jgi:hypothetical protein